MADNEDWESSRQIQQERRLQQCLERLILRMQTIWSSMLAFSAIPTRGALANPKLAGAMSRAGDV
jgi:hypothetical protein